MQYKVETLLPYKNDSSNVTVLIFKLFLILKHYKVNYTHDIFAPKYSLQKVRTSSCIAAWHFGQSYSKKIQPIRIQKRPHSPHTYLHNPPLSGL